MKTQRLTCQIPVTDGLQPSVIELAEGRITSVEAVSSIDRDAPIMLPGLVDIHCHGGGGASLATGDPEQIRTAADHHLRAGTTTLIGSTVTDTPEALLRAVAELADAADEGVVDGIHLEGPFIAPSHCGAHDPELLLTPDLGLADELIGAARGWLRMVTLAPELPGAAALAERLVESGIRPALGHTAAEHAQAARLARMGGVVTHLFNGMPPLHHRSPGPVAAALSAAADGVATLELIADGVHVDDAVVRLVIELVGADRVAFVSDAMSAAGLGDGDYRLGPLAVRVVDGIARLADGDSIAGGTARLSDVVRRQVTAGLPPIAATAAASSTPAAVVGLAQDRGRIAAGLRADLVHVDDDWQVRRVMRAGKWIE